MDMPALTEMPISKFVVLLALLAAIPLPIASTNHFHPCCFKLLILLIGKCSTA